MLTLTEEGDLPCDHGGRDCSEVATSHEVLDGARSRSALEPPAEHSPAAP